MDIKKSQESPPQKLAGPPRFMAEEVPAKIRGGSAKIYGGRSQKLKNKNILITAGSTWVAIDKVRVISNIATGETGKLLAKKLVKLGAKVKLILGPKNFNELKNLIIREIKKKKYDILIHSAAVCDYEPLKVYRNKIGSGLKNWQIKLAPTEKIINRIKKIDPNIFLIGFKFEPDASKGLLIKEARGLIVNSEADLVVANTLKNNQYRAFVVSQNNILGSFSDKVSLANGLISAIIKNY